MTGTGYLILFIVLVLFLFSVLLAVAEMAFARMSRIRALSLEEEGAKGASRLVALMEHPEQTINSLLLLVLFAQLTSASLVGILLEQQFGPYGVLIGLVLQIVLFFAIGEVAPKTYAIQHTDKAALKVSGFLWVISNFPPLRAISRSLIGFANIVLPGRGLKSGPFVTEKDLRAMADVAADESSIESDEREMIHSIFEFGDAVVREVMIPRPDMFAIEAKTTVAAAVEQATERGLSRIPVFEGTVDSIVGLAYLKDLFSEILKGSGTKLVRDMVRPAVIVPEQKKVPDLFREMQGEKFHMAIVVDEHGGVSGLVTLEDLLEEIVGEIVDEYDIETPDVEQITPNSFRVKGKVSIDEIDEILDSDLPDDEWDTIGGFIFNLAGHVPAEGETINYQNLKFRIEKVDGQRIAVVMITRLAVDLTSTTDTKIDSSES